MPKYRAETPGERQSRFLRDLDLIDALQLVLHRVLNRDDFPDRIVDLMKRAVKRSGLTAARWAGNQRNSMWKLEHALEKPALAFGHSHPVETENARTLAQQT